MSLEYRSYDAIGLGFVLHGGDVSINAREGGRRASAAVGEDHGQSVKAFARDLGLIAASGYENAEIVLV